MLNTNLSKIGKIIKKYELNKFDILYIFIVIFSSFGIIFFNKFFLKYSGNTAIIKYNNKEIMKVD